MKKSVKKPVKKSVKTPVKKSANTADKVRNTYDEWTERHFSRCEDQNGENETCYPFLLDAPLPERSIIQAETKILFPLLSETEERR